jgi:hypothetical protein
MRRSTHNLLLKSTFSNREMGYRLANDPLVKGGLREFALTALLGTKSQF